MKKMLGQITDWLVCLSISGAVFAVVFSVAFHRDGPAGVFMALKFVLFLQLPGVALTKYVFEDRFTPAETAILGTGAGLAVIPFLVYVINIFEVAHARTLSFLVPVLVTIVFTALNGLGKPGRPG